MQASIRQYNHAADYEKVGAFLARTYRTSGGHINWTQPRWEYMHYHPYIERMDLNSIGVWKVRGEIVGVVHPELSMGTAYFEIDPAYDAIKTEMLGYAEEHISAANDGAKTLRMYINDQDEDFQDIASEMGYAKLDKWNEPMSHFAIPDPFPPITLPDGFRLKSLAEDNDLHKVARVIFRGFNHGDEAPENMPKDMEYMQSAPNFRKDLTIVVEAPDGNFVSYCGMWNEPVHSMCLVEPVATDPDYRRMGLGSAAVLEGIRRCGQLGATTVCVEATMPFYLSLGFRKIYNRSLWQREWT